jgi:catechol 2,3-dioxygenase-like lactoylglutathione lyase family enzyme
MINKYHWRLNMWEVNNNKLIPELSVKDYSKSIEFYVSILGFDINYCREEDKFAMISINKAQIMIEEINEYWKTGELEYPFGRGINLQIEVTDVNKMAGKIKDNEIKLFREIEENWYEVNGKQYGYKEFLIQDPDGYLLRFCEDIGIKKGDK